jgi:hypothetical protein
MDPAAERIKCVMEAIDHGLSVAEALEECPHCAPGPVIGGLQQDRWDIWAPTAFSETL